MTEIIRTEALSKFYRNVKAVTDLSLKIREGEIYGFLGLNGAGKTTTIRMLLGLIRPTSGVSFILGKKIGPGHSDLWKDVGYMVEIPYSYPDLSVRENLEIVSRLRYINDKRIIDRIMEKLQIAGFADRKVRHLSQGNAQRLGLAKAMIHNPGVLILDEPTNGLDPAGIVEIRELLKDLSLNNGVTIFISSHILDEISRLATRIGIIHESKLIREISHDQLDQLSKKRLIIDAADKNAAIALLAGNSFSAVLNENGKLEIEDEYAISHPDEIAKLLVYGGILPTLLMVEEENLESFFLRATGRKGGAE